MRQGLICALLLVARQVRCARTVEFMSFPLADVFLGDLIRLPDGRQLAVRSKTVLHTPADTLAGFVVAGELELVLGTPDVHTAPIAVYVKHRNADSRLAAAVELDRGVSSYWAPHLPGVKDAMSELRWRVLRMPGNPWPAVVLYRGAEAVLFLRTHDLPPGSLDVRKLARGGDETLKVDRYSAAVVGSPAEEQAPARKSIYERITADVR